MLYSLALKVLVLLACIRWRFELFIIRVLLMKSCCDLPEPGFW